MNKWLALGVIFMMSLLTYAQHTLIYTHENRLFDLGKEFFHQHQYSASLRSFESFLKQAEPTQAGQIHEAKYYIAANSFELRQAHALKLLQDFISSHPYTTFSNQVHLMAGILWYEQKNYAEALNYFNRVNQFRLSTREQAEFLFCKGYALLETHAYEQALPVFRRLRLQESSYRIDASYYYAYAHYALRQFESALNEFLKIENEEKYRETIAFYLVQIYYQLGNYDEMNRRADVLLTKFPQSPHIAEINRIRGEMAFKAGQYAQAVEYLRRYESLSSVFLRNDFYMLGVSLIRLQRFNTAIPYLQKVTTEKDLMTENAYMHLGNAFLKANNKVNARLAFEAALSTNFNPQIREEALLNYALATYETTAAFGESISALEQFLREFPNSRHANNVKTYLANEYMATKNFEVAYESLQRIANPNARMLEAKQYILYQLGTEAFTRNDYAKAIEFFTRSIQNAPTGIFAGESYFWRSESFYRTNEIDRSISDLQTFLKMTNVRNNPNFAMAHYNMGYAHFAKRNFREARRFFELFISLERNTRSDVFVDALNRIGDCFFYERDFVNAEIQYTRSVNLSPQNADYALFKSAYVAGLQRKHTTKISRLSDLVANMPNSEYVDDALYEIGRAHIMLNNENAAIETYRSLLTVSPNSAVARKAALEIGMIYLNMEQLNDALAALKVVIAKYTGSPEAFSALEIMENIYIQQNNVPEYLAYLRTINMTIPGSAVNREDSISFVAAERQYMQSNFNQAITGLRAYINNFCPGGRHCIAAQHYLADSYYRINDFNNALIEFEKLLQIPGNRFMEEAAMRCAEITYNQGNFQSALGFFQQFERLAQTTENRNIARLGVLRSSFELKDYATTIQIAGNIINDQRSNNQVVAEARFNRAKAHIELKQYNMALDDVRLLSADTRTATGAESKYLLAFIHFQLGNFAAAESEVLDFARKNTPFQYWLARGFILLSDIYIRQGNDFQAKQYLLSLQRNYTTRDDIQDMIRVRLEGIAQRERANLIR